MNTDFEVIVVGLGIHGAATAATLARQGLSVLGLEQFSKPSSGIHAHGSSHGRSRVFRIGYSREHHHQLLERSRLLWQQLQHDYERLHGAGRLWHPTGCLVIGAPDTSMVRQARTAAERYGDAHELLSAAELARRYPEFCPRSDEVAVLESDGGWLDAEKCVLTYLQLAEEHGAQLHFAEQMTSWQQAGDGVHVCTSLGHRYTAGHVVLAVGPWAASVYAETLDWPLLPRRRIVFWFQPVTDSSLATSQSSSTRSFDDQSFANVPAYIWDLGSEGQVYGFPVHPDLPDAVKIGGGPLGPHWQATCPPESAATTPAHCQAELDAMRGLIAHRLPSLNGDLLMSQSCWTIHTPNSEFLIDRHPRAASVVLVSACSGHGFKFAPIVAELVASLLASSPSTTPDRLFPFSIAALSLATLTK